MSPLEFALACLTGGAAGFAVAWAQLRRRDALERARTPRRRGDRRRGGVRIENLAGSCIRAPSGWLCTRAALHDGPCAAIPIADDSPPWPPKERA